MKILTIMGGPRKGYGTKAMERFEQELRALHDLEFEYLYLKDVNLQQCRGCCNCFFKGEDKCPVGNDDRDMIFHKMDEADGIIFMAPAYALHIPALMKNFFDRFSYIFHRPYFFRRISMGICNYGIYGAKAVTSYFREVAEAWGMKFVKGLELKTIPYEGAEEKMIKKMQKASKAFLKALNGNRYKKPSSADLIGYKIRKYLYNYMGDETNADYKYWYEKGWLDEDSKYYYDVKRGIGANMISGFITMLAKPQVRSAYSGDSKEINRKYLKLEALNFQKKLN